MRNISVQLEMPPAEDGTVRQQLKALQSYLHRTAQQLQWAFDTVEKAETGEKQFLKPSGGDSGSLLSQQSAKKTFESIKYLIIKSADIVNAYSDTIEKKLEGSYVAQSDFGTYREQTALQLKAASDGIQQLYESNGILSDSLSQMEDQIAAARGYIRTGCLQEGAFPVYGLEIGQRNTLDGQEVFHKYARFTADRLSFFDASDVEVAYVSDYKLYITNAQVGGVFQIGSRFQIFCDSGLAFKWIGGTKSWQAEA